MKQKDINYLVSKELGIPESLVEEISDHFWLSLRDYLSNPEETKKGVLIHNFGRFHMSKHKLERNKSTELYGKLLKQLNK